MGEVSCDKHIHIAGKWRKMFSCHFSISPVKNWNQTTLSQVDRFLFFLPETVLQQIPMVSPLLVFMFQLIHTLRKC